MLKCIYSISPRLFHIRGGVGTCQTPIGNWGLVNDLCHLIPAPPKYRGGTSHIELMCRVFYYVSLKGHPISQMFVVCVCYCYNFHLFHSFASEWDVL